MQTFVPYDDIERSVHCLDRKRLGKQRLEAFQILRCLRGFSSGWSHHPAVRMHEGYEEFLSLYMNACILEWIKRGYNNTMQLAKIGTIIVPHWWGSEIHATHRAALLYKDFEWYSQFGWSEKPQLAYYWPASQTTEVLNIMRQGG